MIECDLARDALGIAGGEDRAGIDATSVGPEDAAVLPEQLAQQWIGEGRQLADGADTNTLQPKGGGRPAPGQPGQWQGSEKGRLMARLDDDETAGFAQLGGDFGDELAAGHTDAEVEPAALLDFIAQAHRDGVRLSHERLLTADVQVRLIERDRLDHRRVAIEDPENRRGRLAVRLEVAGHEDRLRAQPPGTAERHRGANPERAGFVGRRRHDAALAGDARAAHDHGLAAEVRAAKLFHGGVERIEIDVHHDPAHDASLSTS